MSVNSENFHNSREFTSAHRALLSKMSTESGFEATRNTPVDQTGGKTGLAFSLLAHLVLLGCFVIGLNWKTQEPAAFEAVLWSELPAKELVAVQKPKPEPISEPKKSQSKSAVETPAKTVDSPKADIQLPQQKAKKPEPKAETKKVEQKKAEVLPETKKAESKTETKPQPKAEPRIDPELAKQLRQEELARITGGAPKTASSSSGSSKNKAQYSDLIRQYVRSKIVFPSASSIEGNPEAAFEVRQFPTGEIVSITQKKSSGIPAWDSAVESALQRSSPLPKAEDGSVETILLLTFRPKDF